MLTETGSSLATFATCPRKYDYKYNKMLEPKGYPSAMVVGSIVHAIAEDNHNGKGQESPNAYDQTISDMRKRYPSDELAPRLKADIKYATRVGHAWASYWNKVGGELGNANLDWIQVEREWGFQVNANRIVGKSDGYLKHKSLGKSFLYELKTAADRDRESYLTMLQANAQINNNAISLIEEGKPCDGIIYDIIWKPALRQKVAETEDQFHDRVISTIEAEPGEYFSRIMIYRSGKALQDHAVDLLAQLDSIKLASESRYFYRNTGSCRQYFSTCPYFEMCVDNNGEMESFYEKRPRRHSELSEELQKEST